MAFVATYAVDPATREEIDALPGLTLLEFGVAWCPHCQAAQDGIRDWLAGQPLVVHRKIEDGPGRRLGRSYQVKLWPTLILLRDGQEIARLVRPGGQDEWQEAFAG